MSVASVPAEQRSPQVEDGYIRIANELYDAITAHPFKQTTLRVLLAVLRKTYGFGKKEDDLSASQLAALCGKMSRQHVTTALNELAAMRVINKRPGVYGSLIGVNKDYSAWLDSPNLGQVSESRTGVRKSDMSEIGTSPNPGQVSESRPLGSPNLGQVDSPNLGHTKDNLPKDNQQKEAAIAASCADQLPLAADETGNAPPPIAGLPLNDGSEHSPSPKQVAEWSAAYPAVDVSGEFMRMRAWLNARPSERKTRRGIDRFIVSWLGRSQRDTGAARSTGKPSGVIHGNFGKQNYHAGISEDGRF